MSITYKSQDGKSLTLVEMTNPAVKVDLNNATTAGANTNAACLKQFPEKELVINNVNCEKANLLWDSSSKTVYCKLKETEVYVCPEGYTLRASDKKCVYPNDKIDYVCPSNTTYCPEGITGLTKNNACIKPKTIQDCKCICPDGKIFAEGKCK